MSFARAAAIAAAAILLAILLYGIRSEYFSKSANMEKITQEAISLKTLDGETIAGALYGAANPKGAVVFVHMMPATKESWNKLATAFAEAGYIGLAIDLRGHGESTGGPRAYAKFSDEEHQKSILDLDAAAKFLLSKGFTYEQIACVGASIGANLCLKYLADHPEYKTAVLLSAGLNYRGIETELAARALKDGARVLIVSAKDDDKNSEESAAIFGAMENVTDKKLQIYESRGHGTELLNSHPELYKMILEFIGK